MIKPLALSAQSPGVEKSSSKLADGLGGLEEGAREPWWGGAGSPRNPAARPRGPPPSARRRRAEATGAAPAPRRIPGGAPTRRPAWNGCGAEPGPAGGRRGGHLAPRSPSRRPPPSPPPAPPGLQNRSSSGRGHSSGSGSSCARALLGLRARAPAPRPRRRACRGPRAPRRPPHAEVPGRAAGRGHAGVPRCRHLHHRQRAPGGQPAGRCPAAPTTPRPPPRPRPAAQPGRAARRWRLGRGPRAARGAGSQRAPAAARTPLQPLPVHAAGGRLPVGGRARGRGAGEREAAAAAEHGGAAAPDGLQQEARIRADQDTIREKAHRQAGPLPTACRAVSRKPGPAATPWPTGPGTRPRSSSS